MSDINHITGQQVAAARAMLGLGQVELAALANISAPTLRRMEAADGRLTGMKNNIAALVAALESKGIEFVNNERGEGVVKLRDR